jgi:voltage-gated potassium channel
MIFSGVLLIPWQLGELIKQLVKTANQVEKICSNCGLSLHDSDANFCKICGFQLPSIKPKAPALNDELLSHERPQDE